MKYTKKQFLQTHGNPDSRPARRTSWARMRHGGILADQKSVLLAACVLLIAGVWEGRAQVPTANPPSLMTYQGYLVDANGAPLATNAPQNYDVIFRIYTASQGGNDLWSEQQTVTVDKGYFSVLLGQGSQYNGELHGNLADLFAASDASDRYVEITVKGIGSGGSDVTILPRLRLLTSPYSFLAQNAVHASSLVNNSNQTILSASGTKLTVNGSVTANSVAAPTIITGAAIATGISAGSLSASSFSGDLNLQGGSIYMDNRKELLAKNSSGGYEGFLWPRYSDDASYLNYGTGGFHIRNNSSANVMFMSNAGNVGVGTASPSKKFQVGDTGISGSEGMIRLASRSSVSGSGASRIWDIGVPQTGNTTSGKGYSFVIDDIGLGSDPEFMVQWGTGNVGIGTTSPAAKLHVRDSTWPSAIVESSSTVGTWLSLRNTSSGGNNWNLISSGSDNGEGAGKLLVNDQNSGVTFMTIQNNGNVGIGTTSPRYGLEVDGFQNYDLGGGFWYAFKTGAGIAASGSHSNSISIYAAQGIETGRGLYVTSDRRIKKDLRPTDPKKDLDTLSKLKITNYRYVDTVAYGDRLYKKLIAQQVEQVYPQAVSRSVGVIPDIYTRSEAKAGWIRLSKALKPTLKIGDKVRLITEKGSSLHEVTEVKPDGFRVKDPLDGPVFVYGRQVNDFRAVDYDAVAMLNVSATQELYRELQAKNAEIRRLQQQVDALAAREKAQAVRFDKLETLVNRMSPAVRTASLH